MRSCSGASPKTRRSTSSVGLTRSGRVAVWLLLVLAVLVLLLVWAAVITVQTDVPKLSSDSKTKAYAWLAIASVVAAALCVQAWWYLRRVWRGVGGWGAAAGCYVLALAGLAAVFFVLGLIALGSSD